MKRLTRSNKNIVFAGFFGGLGEYLDVDPNVFRIAGVFILLFSGFFPFLFIYLISIIIIPRSKEGLEEYRQKSFYKKGAFWLLFFLLSLALIPLLGFVAFSFRTDSVTVDVSHQVFDYYYETGERNEDLVYFLEDEILEPSFDGRIFADYYPIEMIEDDLFTWLYLAEFYYYPGGDNLSQANSISTPAIINFDSQGPRGYWIPDIQNKYDREIRDNFPEPLHGLVFNFQSQKEEVLEDMEDRLKERAQNYFEAEK